MVMHALKGLEATFLKCMQNLIVKIPFADDQESEWETFNGTRACDHENKQYGNWQLFCYAEYGYFKNRFFWHWSCSEVIYSVISKFYFVFTDISNS